MSYISYSTMPTLRRLVKIATKFRYVCSRNYGFVVFFFSAVSKKAVCESQASCNVSLCGLREMRETKNAFTQRGAGELVL